MSYLKNNNFYNKMECTVFLNTKLSTTYVAGFAVK